MLGEDLYLGLEWGRKLGYTKNSFLDRETTCVQRGAKDAKMFFFTNLSVLTKFRYKISHQLNNVFSFRITHGENLTTWLVWSRLILAMTRHLEIITLLVWIRLLIQTQTTRAHLPLAGCVKIIHFRHTPFKLNKPAVLNLEQERCYRVPENWSWKQIHWWTYFSISSFPHCLIWRT